MTDGELERLKNAVMQYKVVIIKNQHSLAPKKNWELLKRFDHEASSYSTEEFGKLFHPTGQGIVVRLTSFQSRKYGPSLCWQIDLPGKTKGCYHPRRGTDSPHRQRVPRGWTLRPEETKSWRSIRQWLLFQAVARGRLWARRDSFPILAHGWPFV